MRGPRLSPGRGLWLFGCLLLFLFCLDSGFAQDASRKVLKKVEPDYPAELRRHGMGGTVRLKVYIKADGTVRSSEILGGSPALASAAQRAVEQWRFAPAPADSTMELSLVFKPE